MRDKRDFEHFYTKHFDKLYRFVFYRTGLNEQLTCDLVSDIFMKALEHFEGYDESRSTSAWLMTIAKNHLANYWRSLKPTSGLPEDELSEEDDIPQDRIWLKRALTEQTKAQQVLLVRQLITQLDPEIEEIVTLHYLSGYSYEEIAHIKGMTEGAVKVAAHRALKKLRDLL